MRPPLFLLSASIVLLIRAGVAQQTGAAAYKPVIPKTWEITNLSHLRSGDEVNLEVDVIAKYVERIMSFNGSVTRSESLTVERLNEKGYGS